MVLPIVGGLAAQVAGSAATAPLAPIFDWMNQEIYKLMPVRKSDIGALLTLVYRKEIDKVTFYERMARHGFDKDESDRMFLAAEFFPSVQDAIRFAVREADRDDIAALFETDEDFDKLPKEEFLKSRITDKQLKRYWRAHWELPGIGQGFEMFHRLSPEQIPFKLKDIDALGMKPEDVETTLKTVNILLKTLDVMPFWRRRLPLIAYNPIGRIDIRRLEDFDIADDNELEFLNREIGVSPDSAKKMALWTKINNTLKDVIPQLKRTEISFDEAVTKLVEVGATPDAATKLINRRKGAIKKERLTKEKDISKAQFEDAFEFGIMDRDEYKESLIGLNYDDDEAEFLIGLTEFKMDLKNKKKLAKERDLTKSDILSKFELKLQNESDTKKELISIGYDEDEAKDLIEIRKAKIAKKSKKK